MSFNSIISRHEKGGKNRLYSKGRTTTSDQKKAPKKPNIGEESKFGRTTTSTPLIEDKYSNRTTTSSALIEDKYSNRTTTTTTTAGAVIGEKNGGRSKYSKIITSIRSPGISLISPYSKIKQLMMKHDSPSESSGTSLVKAIESDDITREAEEDLHRRPGNMPISETGELASTTLELRFDNLSLCTLQEKLTLSKPLGLDSERDRYFFSTNLGLGGKEYLVVNRSGCSSDDVLTPDLWHQAGVINLSGNNFISLDEQVDSPNLVMLFLQRNNGLSRILSSFFDRMPALRLLDLSNTRISASSLPASLFRLTDLQALMLRSCVCLDSLPPEVGKLKTVEVLDLSGTDLYSLTNEIGELTRIKRLELSFYGPDYGAGYARLPQDLVSPDVFSEMKDLEELSITVHPEDQRWIKIAGNIIQYIKKLEKLSHLEFYFPSVDALNSFVEVSPSWKDHIVRRFKFVVGRNVKRIISRVPEEVESKYQGLEQSMRFINGSHQVPQVMKTVLKSVKAFYLDHHLDIQSLSEFGVTNFNELELCVVSECPNFQVLMVGGTDSDAAFPNLEHLGMHYLWELEQIWKDPVPSGSFQALKFIMVDTCPKIQYIAPQSVLQRLSNLERFVIEDCESLESIVEERKTAKSDVKLLPRLTQLVLRHLPKLATLGCGLFPSEDKVSLHFCPNFTLTIERPHSTSHVMGSVPL